MYAAIVHVNRLEAGTHISRRTVESDVFPPVRYSIPADEAEEIRPDWGKYQPIPTLSALERALRRRGAFSPLPENCVYSFGFDH